MNNREDMVLTELRLSSFELWYLTKYFGPGVLYGINDPTLGMSDEQVTQIDVEVEKGLLARGLLHNIEVNEFSLDESIVPITYSCVHPQHVLTLENNLNQEEKVYYFLPKWQLELSKDDDMYVLKVLKKREELVDDVLSEIDARLIQGNHNFQADINEKSLEFAIYLYEQQQKDKAFEELKKAGLTDNFENILDAYINPITFLEMNMVYHINEKRLINDSQMQLIQTTKCLFQTTRYYHGDEDAWKFDIKEVSFEQAKESLIQMLPKT